MKLRLSKRIVIQTILLLCWFPAVPLAAQLTPSTQPVSAQPSSGNPQQVSPTNPQAISQTGLLPVYGVELRLDSSWVDSSHFPGTSTGFPNSGTSATFQQIWATLQPAGYNVLRIPLDVRDPTATADRAANLCLWAKSNNVQLVFVLNNSDPNQPIAKDFPKQAADFVKTLVALMRANSGQQLPSYSQIMAYQLEEELNHAGRHGAMSASSTQQIALEAAKAVRDAERDALNGTGTAATPLMASASFDFELIKAGAIAGGTMTDAAYNQAYQSLKQFLAALSSSEIDLLAVDWFPGTLGAGGIEKAPSLLKNLIADFRGKQIVLTAGFSSAFRSAEEQKRLFATAFSNLSDFRASSGPDCPFVGVVFREALNGQNPNPAPPRASLPAEMDKWDWKARAAELTAMWTQGKKSDDMAWWLAKVENNMGLVTLKNDVTGIAAPAAFGSPALQGMNQIATAVSDVNAQMANSVPANLLPGANAFQSSAASSISPAGNNATTPTNPPIPPSANPSPQTPCASNSSFNNPAANNYGQQYVQPYSQPYGQQYSQPYPQTYGQPFNAPGTYPGVSQTGSNCGSAFALGLQGEAQRGMLGLLDGVLQRLGSMAGGNALFGGYNNPYGGSGSNVGYSNGQYPPPSNYNGQTYVNPPYNPSSTGGTTPLNIQVSQTDVTLQPANLQAGSAASIGINVHNQGAADAYGLVVQAMGSDGITLGQQTGLHVSRNSSSSTSISWTPASAQSNYSISINVVDSSGNPLASAQTGLLTIAPAPTNGGTGTTGNNGSGSGGTTAGGGSSGNSGNSGGTTIPIGGVNLSNVQFGTSGAIPAAGQPASLVVSLSNPYSVQLSNLKGTLSIDGNIVQTQTISLLAPQQNRSFVFQGVTFAQAGQHQISVSVDSQRPGAQTLTSTYNQSITVPAAQASVATAGGVRKVGGTHDMGGAVSISGLRNSPSNVRSVTPPAFQIGHLVVPSRPAPPPPILPATNNNGVGMPLQNPLNSKNSSVTKTPLRNALPPPPQRPGALAVQGGTLPSLPGRPAADGAGGSLTNSGCAAPVAGGVIDLSLSGPGTIAINPRQPRPGQTVTFTAKVTNVGTAAVPNAEAIFTLLVDGQKVSESPRVRFAVSGRSCSYPASWTVVLPLRGRTIEVRALVVANGDVNLSNNEARLSFAMAAR